MSIRRRTAAAIALLTAAATVFAVVWGLAGAGAQGANPALLRHPYLQQMTANSVIIAWTTDKGAPSEVHYGAGGSLASTATASSDLVTEPALQGIPVNPNDPSQGQVDEPARTFYVHVAHLTGLQAGTTYNYTVLAGGLDLTAADGLSFHTGAGPSDSSVRMLVFGDSGTGGLTQLYLRAQMLGRTFDIAIHTGDVAYFYGSYYELERNFFDAYRQLVSKIPFWLVPGNHDYQTLGGQPFVDDFYLPENADPPAANERYFSFDYGPVHFAALDSEILVDNPGPATSQQMLDWLDHDLAATDQPWKIVILHRTPYTSSNIPSVDAEQRFLPIIERHDVDLVLSGHHHLYARTLPMKNGVPTLIGDGGIPHVNTGGGGGGLHQCQPRSYTAICLAQFHFLDLSIASDCVLSYNAIDSTAATIDHFELNRCNPDSDIDGLPDSADPYPMNQDGDSDGLPDGAEVNTYHTDPANPDTDGDTVSDGNEVNVYHTNPLRRDTDGDGLGDGDEVSIMTNPLMSDSDGDGLSDGDEVNIYNTSPLNPDSDGDGYSDGAEVQAGTDPLDPDSHPSGHGTPVPTATPTRTRTPTPTRPPSRPGDENCDGQVNSIDAAIALQRSAGLLNTLPCSPDADVNRDGRIDSIDAALILQFVAGLLDHLPP